MGITNNHNFLSNTKTSDDPLEKIIEKYKNHPSITCINKHMTNYELTFTFQPVTKNQISKLIKLSNDKKAVQPTDISTKSIKDLYDLLSKFKYKSVNHCVTEGNYIADLQKAKVCPIYKNDGRANKSNYRPISILSNVSKIYERCLCSHLLIKIFFQKTNVAFVKASVFSMPF